MDKTETPISQQVGSQDPPRAAGTVAAVMQPSQAGRETNGVQYRVDPRGNFMVGHPKDRLFHEQQASILN